VRLCVLGDVFRIIEVLPPAWGSRAVHGMFVSLDKRWRSHRIPRETRKKMIRSYRGLTPQIPESCYVDQSAQLIGDIELGEHASVWMNAVLRGDVHSIRVGHYSNIQDCSVLHGMKEKFGVFLGDYVTVGHSVTLHGCTIEDRCLIGMGSIVLNGARIGSGSIIAAGTLIPEGTVIEPNSLWMGSPGKFRRRLEEKDQEMILMYAENYLGYKEMYLKEK
jgi:carbonic anhydrase/acetyltransferase-like protein (isoleucine patch superfamily)